MAGMERKHYRTLSASVSDSDVVSHLRRQPGTTNHGKKVPSCSTNLSILGHDGNGQTCCDEDEYGLEAVGNYFALLDIRLGYPHLVFGILCAVPEKLRMRVAAAVVVVIVVVVVVVASMVDKGRRKKGGRGRL